MQLKFFYRPYYAIGRDPFIPVLHWLDESGEWIPVPTEPYPTEEQRDALCVQWPRDSPKPWWPPRDVPDPLPGESEPRQIAKNPANQKQARVFYDMYVAPPGHPQAVMRALAEKHGFTILAGVPQSIADGWDFWIEFETEPDLPNYFRPNLPWKPVGQA